MVWVSRGCSLIFFRLDWINPSEVKSVIRLFLESRKFNI